MKSCHKLPPVAIDWQKLQIVVQCSILRISYCFCGYFVEYVSVETLNVNERCHWKVTFPI